MNGKAFDNWQKSRKKGCLNWLFKTTFVTAILYIIFNVIFHYPTSDAASITIFLSDNALNYSIYTIGMFFAFWAICYTTNLRMRKKLNVEMSPNKCLRFQDTLSNLR
ncbi:TPA: hypothetical protein PZ808_002986 [Staphylococcus aureus]|uniref:Uncharacterized protein n=1 Tax=Vibrio campbellii (strain ATCC BAA-1116) TaxID=2902295 RepID=A7N8W4_VIBC1|nr:hypothetical protein [Vibrio campbellii]ABU75042.1 hypothetical protein VIBHAR_p08195 [Vibrio campbellii ATCC BAA-1116]AGU99052.1 hypothetical protein M892_28405 [Vibrio campbellii ATCC BAA-1116]HDM7598049.1 hypothetical protein [Staphylococcus aureus]